ncbi:hypothetical protein D3C81_1378630 [compost metagenome]
MDIQQGAHQAKLLPAAQGGQHLLPGRSVISTMGVDHRRQHLQTCRAEQALARFGGGDHRLQRLRRLFQIAQGNLPANARPCGQKADFVQCAVSDVPVPRGDGVEALQMDFGVVQLAQLQVPVDPPHQAVGQQPVQIQLDGVFLQTIQIGEGFLLVAGQPLRAGEHHQHAQHRIGDGEPFEQIDLPGEQLDRRVDFVDFVEHLAEQRRCQAPGIHAGFAAALGLVQHFAIDPFGLGHSAFHGQAEPGQAAPLEDAGGSAEQRLAIHQHRRPFVLYPPRLRVLAAMQVEPGEDVAA